jgi:rubrerythrin
MLGHQGYSDIASVFRSTAEGETGHAHGHLEFLQEVKLLPPPPPRTARPLCLAQSNVCVLSRLLALHPSPML